MFTAFFKDRCDMFFHFLSNSFVFKSFRICMYQWDMWVITNASDQFYFSGDYMKVQENLKRMFSFSIRIIDIYYISIIHQKILFIVKVSVWFREWMNEVSWKKRKSKLWIYGWWIFLHQNICIRRGCISNIPSGWCGLS